MFVINNMYDDMLLIIIAASVTVFLVLITRKERPV